MNPTANNATRTTKEPVASNLNPNFANTGMHRGVTNHVGLVVSVVVVLQIKITVLQDDDFAPAAILWVAAEPTKTALHVNLL